MPSLIPKTSGQLGRLQHGSLVAWSEKATI